MTNKYVDFISDEDFLECVRSVCESYPEPSEEIDMEDLQKNVIDPFKMTFDIYSNNIKIEDWKKLEKTRQKDKNINNKIGEFHQKILGRVDGWTDLGTGDNSRVDLRKNDYSIFIELKNKHNTMNSDATNECRSKLKNALQEHPDSIAYWGLIVPSNGKAEEIIWVKNGERIDNLKKATGEKVYEIVTGNSENLKKVWLALPKAIAYIKNQDLSLTEEQQKELLEFYKYAFKR
ncbi:MAG: Eco47II family restriction endonuclease [Candidatus Nanoarchaeia archaeon]